MKKISVLINTYNEEKMVGECLEHLQWADEIVVVDSASTDNTTAIARRYTDKVISIPRSNFSDMRNAGLRELTGDWVLVVDADERVLSELAAEIRNTVVLDPEEVGFYIPFHNFFLGKWIKHCDWYPCLKLRLFKRSLNHYYSGLVHETLHLDGKTGKLNNHINHYSYSSVEQYVNKSNLYTTLAAESLLKKGRKVSVSKMIFRPISHFTKTYFFRGGFLDGVHGLILSILQSYYVFLRTVKVWQKQNDRRQYSAGNSETMAEKT